MNKQINAQLFSLCCPLMRLFASRSLLDFIIIFRSQSTEEIMAHKINSFRAIQWRICEIAIRSDWRDSCLLNNKRIKRNHSRNTFSEIEEKLFFVIREYFKVKFAFTIEHVIYSVSYLSKTW